MLLDQHDFLVVGVLGTQGVGKSRILSALAGDDRAKCVVVLLGRQINVNIAGFFIRISAIACGS